MNGRRATGGRVEVKVRLREPLSGQDAQTSAERWLVISDEQVTVKVVGGPPRYRRAPDDVGVVSPRSSFRRCSRGSDNLTGTFLGGGGGRPRRSGRAFDPSSPAVRREVTIPPPQVFTHDASCIPPPPGGAPKGPPCGPDPAVVTNVDEVMHVLPLRWYLCTNTKVNHCCCRSCISDTNWK